eukprot:scaffold2913_cov181-Ochromonas_danica.AAC.20
MSVSSDLDSGFILVEKKQKKSNRTSTTVTPLVSSSIKREHLLSEAELEKFPTTVAFAQQFLLTTDRTRCMLFYHEDQQRMDLKFKNSDTNRFCYIQFEPGFPEMYFNEDL